MIARRLTTARSGYENRLAFSGMFELCRRVDGVVKGLDLAKGDIGSHVFAVCQN